VSMSHLFFYRIKDVQFEKGLNTRRMSDKTDTLIMSNPMSKPPNVYTEKDLIYVLYIIFFNANFF